MAQRKTLTEAQLEVLQWIEQGCPDGVMPPNDYAHRVSAAALARRGLAETTGHGPAWSAKVTDGGRAYLESTKAPGAPIPRQANASVTQKLVEDVIAAGGALRVPAKPYHQREGIDYRRRAELAERYGKVPTGKQLAVRSVSSDELEISLVEADGGTGVNLQPVPVPERVARYHSLVRRFRARSEYHEVSRAALPRASRILQGLVVEAERRGHRVEIVSTQKSNRHQEGWTGANDGHFTITAGEDSTPFRLCEEGLGSRTHWENQNRTYSRFPLDRGPKLPPLTEYEAGATGRLTIAVAPCYGRDGRQAQWSDRKSWTLEEKLPEVLREAEVRAVEAERDRRAAEETAAKRRRDWEVAMERAKERYAEAFQVKALEAQSASWRRAEGIRAYCDAAAAAHPDSAETQRWTEWARRYADQIDPLREAPRAPELPESIRLDELEPFLNGWSPYGPERGRW